MSPDEHAELVRAAPALVDERGQAYLFPADRIAADSALLRDLWYAEDREAITAARASGEDGIVPLVLSRGDLGRICLECLVSTPCPWCERFGPRDSLLDWPQVIEEGVDLARDDR